MSKSFPMSHYATLQDLYKAKAEYYEKLFIRCAEMLVETEDLSYNSEACMYYYTHSGDFIGESI